MKTKMKKTLQLLLVLVMMLSFSVVSLAEETPVEDPTLEEPAAEEPATEEPVAEEPAAEEPVVEEPVAEEPAAEEPVAEEPVVEVPFNAVVTLTIDEEINFVMNEDGSVAEVTGLDEETAASFAETPMTLSEMIDAILAGYEEEVEYDLVLVTNDEDFAMTVTEELSQVLGDDELETELGMQPEFIAERFAAAEELGITPGKMRLLEKLQASSQEELDLAEWSQMDVKDIMKEIKANQKAVNIEETDESAEEEVEVVKPSRGKGRGKSKGNKK